MQGRMSYRGVLQRIRGQEAVPSEDDIAVVLARLAATPDGSRFLDWVYAQTLAVEIPPDASEGALRQGMAIKSFATRIFNLLERGRIANGRRGGTVDGD